MRRERERGERENMRFLSIMKKSGKINKNYDRSIKIRIQSKILIKICLNIFMFTFKS